MVPTSNYLCKISIMLIADLLEKKIAVAIALLKSYEPPEGYQLAFSGGKDSQVLLLLSIMANVRFNAFFCRTSVDPPEVLQFIQDYYPDVSILSPPLSMFQLIEKNGCLPTRMIKYCCRQLKEYASPEPRYLVAFRVTSVSRKPQAAPQFGIRLKISVWSTGGANMSSAIRVRIGCKINSTRCSFWG